MTKEQKQRVAGIAEELRNRLESLTDVQSRISDDDEDYATIEEAYQSLRDACDSLEEVGQ
jgi:hypothetical protein